MENRTLMARAERLYQQLRGPLRESLGDCILRFETVLNAQDARRIKTEAVAFESMLDEYDSEKFINPPEPIL
jgi:molecular chaperone HscC